MFHDTCGILSAVCLNLPLDIRYKPENMYIAGIVPGPAEPHTTELNHYVRPIVDDFLVSWERGVHYSRTANYPTGRDTKSAIALGLGDLPAARQMSGQAGHNSHNYCTRCKCFHQDTLCRVDVHHADWMPKDPMAERQKAENWKNAPTRIGQEKLFSLHGVRWSELWRLPYWNPAQMLVVDTMHCLLEGLVEYHFRHLLALTTVSAQEKSPSLPAFSFDLPLPDNEYQSSVALSDKDLDHIPKIHDDLVAEISATSEIALDKQFGLLTRRLLTRNLKALCYVSNIVGAQPTPSRTPERVTKIHYVEGLINWVCTFLILDYPYDKP
jgi:hypothetical protein